MTRWKLLMRRRPACLLQLKRSNAAPWRSDLDYTLFRIAARSTSVDCPLNTKTASSPRQLAASLLAAVQERTPRLRQAVRHCRRGVPTVLDML